MASRMKAWHVIVRDSRKPLTDIKNVEKFSISEAKELEKALKEEHDANYATALASREALIDGLRETDPSAIVKLEPLTKLVVTREWY